MIVDGTDRWRATLQQNSVESPEGRDSLAQRVSAGSIRHKATSPGGTALMSHTYCTNMIHCVFSTKERADLIPDNIRENMFAYMSGIAKNLQFEILALGGTANHVHALIALPAKQSLSFAIRDLKANSSRWMSENGARFSWQQGFGAFSVSPSQVPSVRKYIRNQPEHHKKRNFEEEFLLLLKKSGLARFGTGRSGTGRDHPYRKRHS